MANEVVLKQTAMELGFQEDFLASVLEKLGPHVVDLLVRAARKGFSVELVVELFEKVGPTLLEIIVKFLETLYEQEEVVSKVVYGSSGEEGKVSHVLHNKPEHMELLDGALLRSLIDKVAPILIDKYKDKILSWLLKSLG